jgi:hypothetical protein
MVPVLFVTYCDMLTNLSLSLSVIKNSQNIR